jgi:hypothetical protein
MSAPLVIPEHVLQHAPWSISKAGVIEKCSAQFDYKYGPKKIKELVVFQQATLGVAVHKVLEFTLDDVPTNTAFIHAADQCELTTNERDELKTFYDQVDRFTKRMKSFQKKHGVLPQNRFIERKWAIKPDFSGTDFFDKKGFFRGVVDFAMLTARKDLIIIDHKSGKEKDLKEYETQFKTYCLMAVAKMPEINGVQTAINFTMTDQLKWNKWVSKAQIIEEYRPWLIDYITKACDGLLQAPAPVKGWYCSWCGYKPICTLFGGTGSVPEPAAEGTSSVPETAE